MKQKSLSLSEARKIVNKQGKKYGWEWNTTTGLINKAMSYGKSFIDQWDIVNDIASGNKEAILLSRALIKLSKYELRQSIYNIERRRNKGNTKAEQLYAQRAHDLMQMQLSRLRTEKNRSVQLLQIQNIHREATEKSFRQTPKERGSIRGIKERVQKSVDQIATALRSRELIVKTDSLTADEYEQLSKIANIFDINLDEVVEKYKVAEGDPYRALEKAYIEVDEMVSSIVKNLSADEKEEIVANPQYTFLVERYGIDF